MMTTDLYFPLQYLRIRSISNYSKLIEPDGYQAEQFHRLIVMFVDRYERLPNRIAISSM